MAGAIRKSTLFERDGVSTSLMSSFTTSANGWPMPGSRPKIATRLGPLRTCIQPMSLRSQSVSSATEMMSTTVTMRMYAVECT